MGAMHCCQCANACADLTDDATESVELTHREIVYIIHSALLYVIASSSYLYAATSSEMECGPAYWYHLADEIHQVRLR